MFGQIKVALDADVHKTHPAALSPIIVVPSSGRRSFLKFEEREELWW